MFFEFFKDIMSSSSVEFVKDVKHVAPFSIKKPGLYIVYTG